MDFENRLEKPASTQTGTQLATEPRPNLDALYRREAPRLYDAWQKGYQLRECVDLTMSPEEPYKVWVDEIGQFIRHNSCQRRFRLEYDGRSLAKKHPFAEQLFNPIDPILQRKGQKREDRWEELLQSRGLKKIPVETTETSKSTTDGERTGTESPDNGENALWGNFAQQLEALSHGERAFGREVPIKDELGVFKIKGKMDFVVLRWEDGAPRLRIIEAKASRKDKTYHRIQVATYKLLVEQKLEAEPFQVAGHTVDATSVECVVGRIDEATNEIQDVLQMDPFDLAEEESDVRQLAADGGQLSRILDKDLSEIDYHLNAKCDSCVFDVHCYLESARQNDLEILGINPSEARALRDAGIDDVGEFAELDLNSTAAHQVRQRQTFTSELRTLKERAQARRQNLPIPSPGDEYPVTPYTHDGNSQLPEHEIDGERVVRVYLNVEYDYTEDRVVALSAHVTTSKEDLTTRFEKEHGEWKLDPEVKETTQNGYRNLEGETIVNKRNQSWTGNYEQDTGAEQELISTFFDDLIRAIVEEVGGPTAPVHFYVWSESEIENLVEACSRSGAATIGQLRELLGCREPTEQLIYSSLREEVDSRYGLGWTGRGLVVAASLPWFGDSYHWTRSVMGEEVKLDSVFQENLFDFKTDLYLGEDGWWTDENDPDSTEHKFEIRSRFYDSLPVPYFHAQWDTLPDPEEASDPREKKALQRYQEADKYGYLQEYLEARAHALRWIDEKIGFYNGSINKPSLELRELYNYSLDVEGAAEAALDFLLLEHHTKVREYLSQGVKPPAHRVPTGKTLPLSNVVCGPDKTLRARIDTEGHDIDIETLRDRCSFEEGSFVRISPCSTDQQRGQTVPQLLKAGRTCRIEQLDWTSKKIALDVRPRWDRNDDAPQYRLPSYSVSAGEDLFERATLEEAVGGFVKNRVHRKLIDDRGNHVHKWFDPEDPEIPSLKHEKSTQEIEQLLQEFPVSEDKTLHRSQISCIKEGLTTRTHLIHGPPGTGKTTTIALSALSRLLQDVTEGDVVYMGANTHTAVNNLIESVAEYEETFSRLAADHGFSVPDIELLRIERENLEIPEEVDPISSKGCVREIDGKRTEGVVFIAGTVNQLLKIDKTLSSSKTFGGDEGVFHSPLLIVDEASMMVFPNFLAISELVEEDGRIILSGDHKQLPPIVTRDWDEEDRPPVEMYQPYNSAFEAVRNLRVDQGVDTKAIKMSPLEQSFRLPPAIASLINKIYAEQEGDGIHSRETTSTPEALPEIDSVNDLRHLWEVSSGLYLLVHDEDESRQSNQTEAAIITQLLQQADDPETDSVAILTPHRAQRAQLRRQLEGKPTEDAVRVVDTVEKMQGGECENVIVSATASDPAVIAENEEFLLDLNRANVAFSRAKSRLFVVCSRELLDHIPPEIEEYKSSILWKTLRNRCDHLHGTIEIEDTNLEIKGLDTEKRYEDPLRTPR